MKFKVKYSKERIEFLDALLYIDKNCRLQTTICKKSTGY